MQVERIDGIEKVWRQAGRRRDEDYVWLAHGKYVRLNPDFQLEKPSGVQPGPREGLAPARDVVSQFYNHWILGSEKAIAMGQCGITAGCRDGMDAALRYFKTARDANVLFLVPTFQPLIDIAQNIFNPSRIHLLPHFNEPWRRTLDNIAGACDRERIGCIVLTNPNNPAGIMYPEFFLAGLGTICNAAGIWVIEDGAYFLHYDRRHQSSVIDHCQWAISLITSLKLLLGRYKVGGAVVSESLDISDLTAHVQTVDAGRQMWFADLLHHVALEKPELLSAHLGEMFRVSQGIKDVFSAHGFIPLYGAGNNPLARTSSGPVISFTFKNKNGARVRPGKVFNVLQEHFVLTTPLAEGFRINSRGITDSGRDFLIAKMPAIKRALDGAT